MFFSLLGIPRVFFRGIFAYRMAVMVIMVSLHHRLSVHDLSLVTREQSSNKGRVGYSRPPNPHTRTVNKKNTTSGPAEPPNSTLPRSGYWFTHVVVVGKLTHYYTKTKNEKPRT